MEEQLGLDRYFGDVMAGGDNKYVEPGMCIPHLSHWEVLKGESGHRVTKHQPAISLCMLRAVVHHAAVRQNGERRYQARRF